MDIVPLLNSGHFMNMPRQDCQQYPGTTGPDVAHHLNREHIRVMAMAPLANSQGLPGTCIIHQGNQLSRCLHPTLPTCAPLSPGAWGDL